MSPTRERQSASEESGAEAPAKSALIFDLSCSQGVSLSSSLRARETLRPRLNVLPPARVFLIREPVYRLGKKIPCFVQISFFKSSILKDLSILDLEKQKLN